MNPASSERWTRVTRFVLLVALGSTACADGADDPVSPVGGEDATPFYTALSVTQDGGCALDSIGDAYCWGYRILGDGRPADTRTARGPSRVAGGHTWTDLSVGSYATCGVTDGAELYCWGEIRPVGPAELPVRVSSGRSWASVEAAGSICAIDADNQGYCTGIRAMGSDTLALVPGGHTWRSLSPGGSHICGVTTSSEGYCWGLNWHGRLGLPDSIGYVEAPVPAPGGYAWLALRAGGRHTCGVTEEGVALCWGYNAGGELGAETDGEYSADPVAVLDGAAVFTDVVVPDMEIDAYPASYSCGSANLGAPAVICWGGGQAVNIDAGRTSWVTVEAETTGTACGLTSEGRILCWGNASPDAGDRMMAGETPTELAPPEALTPAEA